MDVEQQERIFVEFSHPRLTTLGISPAEIFSALSRQNAVTPAGSVDTDGAQVFVRLTGHTPTSIKSAIPRSWPKAKLQAIGYRRCHERLRRSGNLCHSTQWRVLPVVECRYERGLERAGSRRCSAGGKRKDSSSLPLGVSLKKITDQAVNISSAVNEFMVKFAMAVGVVMLVSLLSLGWRVGIVVVAAIPLTLGAVFVIMMITDRVLTNHIGSAHHLARTPGG